MGDESLPHPIFKVCCNISLLLKLMIVGRHGGQEVVPPECDFFSNSQLPPEFVQPQDREEKQDCELAAAKRWLRAWGNHYSPWGMTILGDDLYCHQPFCEAAIEQGFDVLLVCKPDSHSTLYDWIADFERI
ncbi:hypothetical protein QUF61_12505 [Candidatus Venteria ishoeyi]|uniref:hypothetical protein n=1 Tax=Candidatus Venteria ishoeyi TaxID=1899563 RepID=UPI0025A61AED|nr:hypothetical protein [Candidatus Venteria ishoeyi]MDM8547310.1 hypothetical protein [Candidatus Venteria ishoeyi]